jgi:hypothetical protein
MRSGMGSSHGVVRWMRLTWLRRLSLASLAWLQQPESAQTSKALLQLVTTSRSIRQSKRAASVSCCAALAGSSCQISRAFLPAWIASFSGTAPTLLGRMREAHPQSLAFPAAPVTAGHVGGGPGLVDEDEAFGFEVDLTVETMPTLFQDVGTVLLDRVPGLFLRVIP